MSTTSSHVSTRNSYDILERVMQISKHTRKSAADENALRITMRSLVVIRETCETVS